MPASDVNGRRSSYVAAGLIALLTFSPAPVAAQTSDPSSALDLIVTAQRQRETIKDVPISITAIEGSNLEYRSVQNLATLARIVPNLNVSPGGLLGTEQVSIRGVSSPTGAPTVSFYLDDTPIQIRPLGFSGNARPHLFDLDRIEVLRGPQGTLFGASSIGGTIRLLTKQPSFESPSGRGLIEFATTEDGGMSSQLGVAFGSPIASDRFAARGSFYHRRDAGVLDRIDRETRERSRRDVDQSETLGVRGLLSGKFGPRLTITPSIFYQDVRRKDLPFSQSDLGAFQQAFINRQPGRDQFLLPSLTIEAIIGGTTLTSITSYFDRDDRQVSDYSSVFGELVLGGQVPGITPPGGTRNVTRTEQRSFSHEVRLGSSVEADRFRWLVGLHYDRTKLVLEQNVVEPGLATLISNNFGATVENFFGIPLLPGGVSYRGNEQVDETEIAGFGSASWEPIERLEGTVGLRISRSKLNLQVTSDGPYAGGLTSTGPRRTSEIPIAPRFALSYRPGRNNLLYTSISRGYRAGGANPPVPAAPCNTDLASFGMSEAPASYGSDAAWSYEIGAKTSQNFFDVSGAIFQVDWSRVQQLIMLPNCGFSFIANFGAARSKGFELEAELRPSKSVRLSLSLAHVDARLRKTITGNANGLTSARAIIVQEGDQLLFTPRWSGNIAAEYTARNIRGIAPYVRAEHQYVGRYQRTPAPPALGHKPLVFRGDSYSNVSIRAGLRKPSWEASLFIDNLMDDQTVLYSSSDLVPGTGSPLRQTRRRPRTFGLNLGRGF